MWESRRFLGEISKGLVGRVGSRFLAFHSPGISTNLFVSLRRFVIGYCGPGSFFFLLFFSR